ncbi:MAG: sugar transferase [Clostridiales bacterium]|jgi:O-antigen biosynthesis protein WbqP|nr:sugar transferase [Eubacteriales bacterium]MDH7565704.1 sugar transferase [Clostridiales bacterium]
MKRLFDLIFSIIMTVILLPVFILIALVIKLSSKGPVIFKQRRIGKDKKEFFIYKFRTMYLETPQNVPTHLLENPDHYITPIGRFLRKTSLDELPQLFNILKGEMSFVGPRPALYNQYDLISLRDGCGVNRVRPGITGWAQVNGRDELEIPVKVEFDRFYVEHYSLWLDAKIIFMTFLNVILAKGVVEGKQTVDEDKITADR